MALQLYLDKVDAGFSPASLEGKNAYVPPPSLAEMFFDCKYLPKCGAIKKCSLKQGVPFLRLPVLGSKTEDQYLTTEIISESSHRSFVRWQVVNRLH